MAAYTEREKKLATITALVLGGALLWLTGLGPAIQRYRDLSSELTTARDNVTRQQRSNRRDKRYKHELRDLRKRLKNAEAAAFWTKLEKAILDCGARMTSHARSNDERKPKVGFAVVRYQLTLECDRTSLQKLLLRFQGADGFLRARQISITTKRFDKLNATVSISTLVPLNP